MHSIWPRYLVAVSLSVAVTLSSAATPEETRRLALSKQGAAIFKNAKNHCKAFSDLAKIAADGAPSVGAMLEDLMVVLIGKGLRERGTGPYYIGNLAGARGDSGFKSELKDKSPQVEHGFAAIYIGKMFPPGSTELIALKTEVFGPLIDGKQLNASDALLYAIGGDIGQRLATSNYRQLPTVIMRTMCE
jgi:hypothetical protein